MHIRSHLEKIIQQSLTAQGLDASKPIALEHPADPQFGDYSTNIALQLNQGGNPRALAEHIVEAIRAQLTAQSDTMVASVTVAGPGFINFTLSDHFLLEEMQATLTKSAQFVAPTNQDKKIVVEFTDPNPFKQFHIGHLYSNTVGESICRLLEATGAQVRRVNYFGDVGMHVAMSVWGMREKIQYELERSIAQGLESLVETPLADRVKFLGAAYAKGATAYKESEKAKAEIVKLNKLLYVITQELMVEHRGWEPIIDYKKFLDADALVEFNYDEIKQLYQMGKEWSLGYFDSIYQRVGMGFDEFYPESEVAEQGMKLVFAGLKKQVFKESQGAIVYEGERHGLHTRVFINSSGLPTYETKELGLAPTKYQDEPYDLSLIITANEINEYFQVLLAAMKELEPELGNKTVHIGHGMVRLPEGKMSSRTGKVITGEWLLDEAHQRIEKVLEASKNGLSEGEREQIAEGVGQAAIKYAFLKSNIGKDIAFDFDESLSFQGNSGPYLQYTLVRCKAVMKKAQEEGMSDGDMSSAEYIDTLLNSKKHFDGELNNEEKDLLRCIYQHSEIVELAAREFSPHYVCTYLFDLAQRFNVFYTKHQIVAAKTKEQRALRLAMTRAVAVVLEQGLGVLNIQVVERM